MRGVVGIVIFVLCLALAYQSYQNAQPTAETENLARSVACDELGTTLDSCALQRMRPGEIRASSFGRRYFWSTREGPLWIACRRTFILYGVWECRPEGAGPSPGE